MGGYRRYFPCEICKKPIDFKAIKDDDVVWNLDDDTIAHTVCVNSDDEKWKHTDEMLADVDIDNETMAKINNARLKHKGKG